MSAQRPPSVRSVTSNSSLASTVSLARRPRIRARSRTVTGSPTSAVPTDDLPPAVPNVSGSLLSGPLVQEPLEEALSPERPPRSPHRLVVETTRSVGPSIETLRSSSDKTSLRGLEGNTFVVEPIHSTVTSASALQSKASSLPHRLGPPVETLRGSDTTSTRSAEGSTFVVEPTQSTVISQASKQASSLSPTALHYVPGTFVQAPHDEAPPSPYLPKSPHHLAVTHGSDTTSSRGVEGSTFVIEPIQSTPLSQSKASKLASSLPHLDTTPRYKPPPSAFSRDPALTPGKNVRDSLSTEQSGMSSSLYPPSTSSAGPASPLSLSPLNQIDAPSIVLDTQEYDGDDVAYRLRLLVQNSYFLPPAHSKPSPADFAPAVQQQQQQKKTNSPTFLDIFRVGKSRSKPTTPTGTGPILPPMLRTTGDSITPAFADQPRTTAPRIQAPTARGRVVVVREKMLDIATAAKQAEQEVKARGARAESQHEAPSVDDDDIDPTDAVDIPLPPPSYPFAVQASALHGLGVADSVGAAVLADLLPPSQNPTLAREYDAAEDSWRKHLLREAVGHSLDNTPDASMSIFSQPLSGGAVSPPPKASKSLEVDRRGSLSPAQVHVQAQTRQTLTQAHTHLLGRKITDALPPTDTTSAPRNSNTSNTTSPGSRSLSNSGNGHDASNATTANINIHPSAPLRPSGESHASAPSRLTAPASNNHRISMKRSLGLPPAAVAEIEMLEGLSLSMPRPGSTLPPRADTPVEPQTPLGPPPRPPRVMHAMSADSGSPGGAGGEEAAAAAAATLAADDAKWDRDNDGPDHSALRRTVSSPSLAEGYESAVSRRASTPPPLPVYSTATPAGTRTRTQTVEYRLSMATVTSFDGTHNGDADDTDYRDYDGSRSQLESGSGIHPSGRSRRSLSDPPESDYGQTAGRVSLALSAFPASSMRTRSPSGSRSRGQSQSRPSLSVSEYSQASQSPTTSAFQEMLNHDHSQDYTYTRTQTQTHRTRGSSSAPPSAALTPEPGFAAATDERQLEDEQQQQEQQYASYIDAARLEAMSPPPRNSSSLAFAALPAPPRSASLAYSGNGSNSALRNSTLSSSSKPHSHSPYAPRPGTAPAPGPGQTHVGRSYSQPPVRRYPSVSTSTSSPATFTSSTTTSTAQGESVLGPAPLAITLEILAPEPTTPPLPPNTSFGDDATIPALPGSGARAGTGSSSFFDNIQPHMDDLDSSEDEDDDDDDDDDSIHHRRPILPPFATSAFGGGSPGRPRTASVAAGSSPHRPMMMKHANFSAPYIRSSAGAGEGQSQSPRLGSDSGHGHTSASGHGHISSKHAVGNVAVKPKPLQPAASSDFFKYTQEHPAAALPSSSAGAGGLGTSVAYRGSAPNLNAKAQESLRRFDGMLQQHIDAEKDTLKRIATTLKQQQQASGVNGAIRSMQDLNLPGRR